MALLGSDFNPTTPRDTDPVANGAAEIRDVKRRLKDFVSVLFNPETGAFKQASSTMTLASSDPSNPNLGDTYFNTTDETAYIFTSSGWVAILKPSLPVGALVYHTGTIASVTAQFANLGGTWLVADGSAISRTTYATYFALIGTTYGVGDGSTTFNIPDCRDSFVVGASADDSGSAKSTVSDGSTLLKSRAYTSHIHTSAQAPQKTDGPSGNGVAGTTSNAETTRVIPPFTAQVAVVRVL